MSHETTPQFEIMLEDKFGIFKYNKFFINTWKDRITGTLALVITKSNDESSANGFRVVFNFEADLLKNVNTAAAIKITDIAAKSAVIWSEPNGIIANVIYAFGTNDLEILTPVLKKFIADTLIRNKLKNVLSAAALKILSQPIKETPLPIEKDNALMLSMEDYRSYIIFGERAGNAVLLFKIGDEKQFFASFEMTYEKKISCAYYNDGVLATPRTNKLTNIEIDNILISDHYDYQTFDSLPFSLTDEEETLVKIMAIEAIEKKYEDDVFVDGEKCELTSVVNKTLN